MSMENFLAFVDKALVDDGLRMQLCSAVESAGDPETSRSTIAKFASSQGYDVNEQDAAQFQVGLKASLVNTGALPDIELTEDELELVAGGVGGFTIPTKPTTNPDEESGIAGQFIGTKTWQKMGLLSL